MSDTPSLFSGSENKNDAIRKVWEMALEACDGDEDRAVRFIAAAFAVAVERSVVTTGDEEEVNATV